jgi:hypothetical protein
MPAQRMDLSAEELDILDQTAANQVQFVFMNLKVSQGVLAYQNLRDKPRFRVTMTRDKLCQILTT